MGFEIMTFSVINFKFWMQSDKFQKLWMVILLLVGIYNQWVYKEVNFWFKTYIFIHTNELLIVNIFK